MKKKFDKNDLIEKVKNMTFEECQAFFQDLEELDRAIFESIKKQPPSDENAEILIRMMIQAKNRIEILMDKRYRESLH